MPSLNVIPNDNLFYSLIGLSLFTLFLWYQGILASIFYFDKSYIFNVFPVPIIVFFLHSISNMFKSLQDLLTLLKRKFYFHYLYSFDKGEDSLKFFLGLSLRILDKTKYTPRIDFFRWLICIKLRPLFRSILSRVLTYLYNNPNMPSLYILISLKSLNSFTILLTNDTWQVLTEYPEMFLRKSMFCNTVTYWLFVFYYRVYMGLELQPKAREYKFFSTFLNFLKKKLINIYNNHRVSPKTRQSLWNFINEDFYKSFFFVKRFKKLNDLIWQDGFLIDFLQKKVVDKWLRGFIIYSANLFSERLLFDRVIRFYIDYVFRAISSISIYEFNSASSILLVNLQLVSNIFIIVTFLYIGLILF
jgi:hypothetical protein